MKKIDFNKLVKLINDYVSMHPCTDDCAALGCPRKNILGLASSLQKALLKGELPEGL